MIGVRHDGNESLRQVSCPGMHYIPCGSRLVDDIHTNHVVSAQKSSIAIIRLGSPTLLVMIFCSHVTYH